MRLVDAPPGPATVSHRRHAREARGRARGIQGSTAVLTATNTPSPDRVAGSGARDAVLDAGTSNGRITFTGTMAAGAHRLDVSNGPISITLPADASFGIDATTINGKVRTAFAMAPTGAVTDTELHATVGQNPGLRTTATATNGDVSVVKGN